MAELLLIADTASTLQMLFWPLIASMTFAVGAVYVLTIIFEYRRGTRIRFGLRTLLIVTAIVAVIIWAMMALTPATQ